jgi:hypothetical protein
MSRRLPLSALALSATLIATQALADPECFGETCRMPEMVEPPSAVLASPEVAEPAPRPPVPPLPNAANQASMPPLVPRPVKALPGPLRVEPAATPAPSPEPNPGVGYVRGGRVSSPDSTYVVGYNAAAAGGIVVVIPGAAYGQGRYIIAPAAKIISIDSDE